MTVAAERGLIADARPHVPLQPAREHHPRPDPHRRARRHLLHLDEPREPRAAPVRRQRRLGSRPARLLDPSLLARGDAVARRRRRAAAASSRRSPTSPSSTSSTAGGAIAHVELSWLAPSKLRRTTIVGSQKMVVYDDVSNEPVRIFDSGVMLDDPQSFGEFQLSYRTGEIVSPAMQPARAAPGRDGRLLPLDPDRREAALVGRARRRGRADDRGGRRFAGLERQSRPARRRRGDRSLSDRADCVLCFLTHVGHTAQEGPYRGDAGSGPICGARHLYGPSLPT